MCSRLKMATDSFIFLPWGGGSWGRVGVGWLSTSQSFQSVLVLLTSLIIIIMQKWISASFQSQSHEMPFKKSNYPAGEPQGEEENLRCTQPSSCHFEPLKNINPNWIPSDHRKYIMEINPAKPFSNSWPTSSTQIES